ncbi:MAG: radical SAM protein [Pseudomonadota bacterium]
MEKNTLNINGFPGINTESIGISPCNACPRECKVDRNAGELGICGTGKYAKVASYNIHHGEEPIISGNLGSGTIFFSGCNLACVYCQNFPISHYRNGEFANAKQLAAMMLKLQKRGAHNINFVSPSHMILQIIEAVQIAKNEGLKIPLVYNSSGYEKLAALKLLNGIIDIYMPDLKYMKDTFAKKYSEADNYKEIASTAIIEMYKQVGGIKLKNGLARKGLLIRHMVLPNKLSSTIEAIDFIEKITGNDIGISLMGQYFPAHKAENYPEINRKLKSTEYESAIDYLSTKDFKHIFVQNEIT